MTSDSYNRGLGVTMPSIIVYCEGPRSRPHAHRRPLVSFTARAMPGDDDALGELGNSMVLAAGEPILGGANLAAGLAEWMLDRPKPTQGERTRAVQRQAELPAEMSRQVRMIKAGPRARKRERNNQGLVHLSAAGERIVLHMGQRVRPAEWWLPWTPAQPGDYCRVWFRCPICHDRLSARGYKLSVVLDVLAAAGVSSLSLPALKRRLGR